MNSLFAYWPKPLTYKIILLSVVISKTITTNILHILHYTSDFHHYPSTKTKKTIKIPPPQLATEDFDRQGTKNFISLPKGNGVKLSIIEVFLCRFLSWPKVFRLDGWCFHGCFFKNETCEDFGWFENGAKLVLVSFIILEMSYIHLEWYQLCHVLDCCVVLCGLGEMKQQFQKSWRSATFFFDWWVVRSFANPNYMTKQNSSWWITFP